MCTPEACVWVLTWKGTAQHNFNHCKKGILMYSGQATHQEMCHTWLWYTFSFKMKMLFTVLFERHAVPQMIDGFFNVFNGLCTRWSCFVIPVESTAAGDVAKSLTIWDRRNPIHLKLIKLIYIKSGQPRSLRIPLWTRIPSLKVPPSLVVIHRAYW